MYVRINQLCRGLSI